MIPYFFEKYYVVSMILDDRLNSTTGEQEFLVKWQDFGNEGTFGFDAFCYGCLMSKIETILGNQYQTCATISVYVTI